MSICGVCVQTRTMSVAAAPDDLMDADQDPSEWKEQQPLTHHIEDFDSFW